MRARTAPRRGAGLVRGPVRAPCRASVRARPEVASRAVSREASRVWLPRRDSMGPQVLSPPVGLLLWAWVPQPGRMFPTQPGSPGTLRPADARPALGMPRAWGPAAVQRVSGRRCRGLLQQRETSAGCQGALPDSVSRLPWAGLELRQAAPARGWPWSKPASVRQCWARQASAPACRRWPPQPVACPGSWSRRSQSPSWASVRPAWARPASRAQAWSQRGARGRRPRRAGRPTGQRHPRRERRRASAAIRQGGGEGRTGS